MTELDWRETGRGLECDGYLITRDGVDPRPWRLEATGGALHRRPSGGFEEMVCRSRKDAVMWAESLERERIRRVIAAAHFLVAAAGFASFVVSSQFIGSLGGLLIVAATLYLAVRSLGNGLGVLLNDAWGWTRLGRSRSSLLERIVPTVARQLHRHRAMPGHQDPPRSVRELSPPRRR